MRLVVPLALVLASATPLPGRSFHQDGRPAGRAPAFSLLALGRRGGCAEGDLSSWLLCRHGDDRFLLLDGGSPRTGLVEAEELGNLDGWTPPEGDPFDRPGWIFRDRVKAVLLSHCHLDHFAGLVANAPFDGPKPLFAMDRTVDALRDHVFNGVIWPNLGSEGEKARGIYRYRRCRPDHEETVEATDFVLRAFPLSHHGDGKSSAFLIRAGEHAAAYLGDTGPDALEGHGRLAALWAALAPLVRSGSLRVLLLECSFDESIPDEKLHGHLCPRWFMKEMDALARSVSPKRPKTALKDLDVVVTHMKPRPDRPGHAPERIRHELEKANVLGLRLHFPVQGALLHF